MEKVIFAVYLDKSYQVQYVTMTPSEAKLPGWGMKILHTLPYSCIRQEIKTYSLHIYHTRRRGL